MWPPLRMLQVCNCLRTRRKWALIFSCAIISFCALEIIFPVTLFSGGAVPGSVQHFRLRVTNQSNVEGNAGLPVAPSLVTKQEKSNAVEQPKEPKNPPPVKKQEIDVDTKKVELPLQTNKQGETIPKILPAQNMTKKNILKAATNDKPKPPSITKESPKTNQTNIKQPGKVGDKSVNDGSGKYLIYLCDEKDYCFGLGDRQRGIVSVYLLAELTGRRFGIQMTSPSEFSEFYKPNHVNWIIPPQELKGKTNLTLLGLGAKASLGLDSINFNQLYPQDVVYIKTNQKFQFSLVKNHLYKDNMPEWFSQHPFGMCASSGWLRLAKPSQSLRIFLNEELVKIYNKMREESDVWKSLKYSKCCKDLELSKLPNICVSHNDSKTDVKYEICTKSGQTNCCDKAATTSSFVRCQNASFYVSERQGCSNISCTDFDKFVECGQYISTTKDFSKCSEEIKSAHLEKKWEASRLAHLAGGFCNFQPPAPPATSTDAIMALKGYDSLDLNLICVHIRLGHSKTFKFENNVRNKHGDHLVVWEFLKPLVAKGQHVYLATDAEELREEAQVLFGERLHTGTLPIVHIAHVQKDQDSNLGFKFSLMEQLLLTTSCKVLVVSYSGFSMKAAQFRDLLATSQGQKAGPLYLFKDRKVVPFTAPRLP